MRSTIETPAGREPTAASTAVSLRAVPAAHRRIPPTVFVLAVAVVLVGAIAVIASIGGDDGDDGATGQGATTDAAADGTAPAAALSGDCQNLHASHGIAMWNPAYADEMTAADCGWPYEPFLVTLDGGEEDPSIAAPFEPRLYDELWQMFGGLGLGVCQVAGVEEDAAHGMVFGFRYAVGPAGCPDMEGDAALVAREYGTRAQRDAAAHASEAPRTWAFGRWVLEVDGDDAALVEQVSGAVTGLGASEVG